jgi:Na+/melibiose symporter-like transporter
MNEEQREVSVGGKFLGLGIVGLTVIACIILEKTGTPEDARRIPWYLLGSVVLGIVIPMLFFRRPIR